jgi:hypothetical protein
MIEALVILWEYMMKNTMTNRRKSRNFNSNNIDCGIWGGRQERYTLCKLRANHIHASTCKQTQIMTPLTKVIRRIQKTTITTLKMIFKNITCSTSADNHYLLKHPPQTSFAVASTLSQHTFARTLFASKTHHYTSLCTSTVTIIWTYLVRRGKDKVPSRRYEQGTVRKGGDSNRSAK